ncbi:MAG: sel1 repeat family protein [Proteobacteria bacterium]|nr:sel1 repeat family protein [Pseudomonadota bacterium]
MKNPQFAFAQAQRDYRRLAAQGHSFAMLNLGMMYENGNGVPKNPAEAARWYEKGAEKDDPACLVRLGILLANGRGVPKDRVKALGCFFRAVELGEPAAQKPAGQVWERMENEERGRASVTAGQEPDYKEFLERLARETRPHAPKPKA